MDLTKPIPLAMCSSVEDWWRRETQRRVMRINHMLAIPQAGIRDQVFAADFEACSRDFFFWAENYAWVIDPHAKKSSLRNVPYHPWPAQRKMIEFLELRTAQGEPALIPKGRKLGISWTCLLLIFHHYKFQNLFGAKIGSRKESLVDDGTLDSLFGKMRHLESMQPPHLKSKAKNNFLRMVNSGNGSEVVGEATNEGFARGARRTIAMIDEFAHVHPKMQASIWLAIESVAVSTWLPSTPNGKGNKFFELYETLPKKCIFEIDWKADPSRGPNWRDEQIRPIGRLSESEFAQEHECDFSAVLTGKIWSVRRADVEYHEESDDWEPKKEKARQMWPSVGGWDFGSGPSLLSCVISIVDMSGGPGEIKVYVDQDITWKQSDWKVAAADTKAAMAQYGGMRIHFGDPAGTHHDSSQNSWESNLQGGGVPLVCHQGWYQTREGMEWMIKEVQKFLDEGRLKIHRRCNYLWSCMENWRRDAPPGVEIDWISRAYIPARKDVYSHGANALMYMLAGVLLTARRINYGESIDVGSPNSRSAEIAKVLEIN